jgi:hypothetical protein
MEFAQAYEHWRHGRFLAYVAPSMLRRGRRIAALTWPIDRGMRGVVGRYLGEIFERPFRPLPRLYLQSVMIIQPVDILADGRMNMCDACPDVTVHDGELVWSCRLEEKLKFGGFARAVPKASADAELETEAPAGV